MGKGVIGCGVLAVLLLFVGMFAVGSYNKLVGLEEGVDSAWAQVENVYQRRADLIPNLVETVRGAKDFEQETLVQVTEARAKVGQIKLDSAPTAAQLQQFQQSQGELASALSRLMVVVERYPELKSTQNFLELQSQLEGAENRIAVERKRFNEVAQSYNAARRRFPTVLLAGMLGFESKAYFQSSPGADQAPAVEF